MWSCGSSEVMVREEEEVGGGREAGGEFIGRNKWPVLNCEPGKLTSCYSQVGISDGMKFFLQQLGWVW